MSEQQPEQGTETPENAGAEESGGSELEEGGPLEIGDAELPEDLQPTKDNPLARHPGQTGEDDDKIGANIEGGDADNPSANMAYSSEDSNEPSDEASDDGDDDA